MSGADILHGAGALVLYVLVGAQYAVFLGSYEGIGIPELLFPFVFSFGIIWLLGGVPISWWLIGRMFNR